MTPTRKALLLLHTTAVAVAVAVASPVVDAGEYVPRDALKYKRDLIRNARYVWGLNAPIAVFAAQVHQESRWRPDARSPFAIGLAQFTPATANWISGVYPKDLGDNQPYNPIWALRALAQYDLYIWNRTSGADACERMAFTLSAYNGGPGWVTRDKALAKKSGSNPEIWFGHVEKYNAGRREDFFKENRGYPSRILLKLQPLYHDWGDQINCIRTGGQIGSDNNRDAKVERQSNSGTSSTVSVPGNVVVGAVSRKAPVDGLVQRDTPSTVDGSRMATKGRDITEVSHGTNTDTSGGSNCSVSCYWGRLQSWWGRP